ncbi:MAG: hypothetical protein ACYC5V_13335, partial [Gemmatimonadaceae bacterium]
YPAVLVVRRHGETESRHEQTDVACAVVRRDVECRWRTPRGRIALEATDGAPWLLLPPPARAAFDALVAHGTPLADTAFGRPLLGVKSGCNDAFVVQPEAAWTARSAVASCTVRSGEREGLIERALLRPALRGEDLAPFAGPAVERAIIWTHDASLQPLPALPPRASRWLSHWRPTLERRTDVRSRDRWWSLFRLEASARGWRVAWGDVGRAPRAIVLPPDDDTVPMNSCYVVRAPSEDDADALAAWLNAPLAVAWLGAIAEPARGGYHRFLGWTVARLPMPADWTAARDGLASIGRDARRGRAPSPAELHESSLRAFRVHASLVEPLLTWMHW